MMMCLCGVQMERCGMEAETGTCLKLENCLLMMN